MTRMNHVCTKSSSVSNVFAVAAAFTLLTAPVLAQAFDLDAFEERLAEVFERPAVVIPEPEINPPADTEFTFDLTDTGVTYDATIPTFQGTTSATTSVSGSFDFNAPVPLPILSCALTVVKRVAGGTASSSDFLISVQRDGAEVSGSPQGGSAAGTTYGSLAAGTYQVSETGPSGYTATFSGACGASGSVTLSIDEKATCIITNTFTATSSTSTPPTDGGNGTTTPPGDGGGTTDPPDGGGGGPGPTDGGGEGGGPGPSDGGVGGGGGEPDGGGGITTTVAPSAPGSAAIALLNPSPSPTIDATAAPGIPNTGVGSGALSTLIASALTALAGGGYLYRTRRTVREQFMTT